MSWALKHHEYAERYERSPSTITKWKNKGYPLDDAKAMARIIEELACRSKGSNTNTAQHSRGSAKRSSGAGGEGQHKGSGRKRMGRGEVPEGFEELGQGEGVAFAVERLAGLERMAYERV